MEITSENTVFEDWLEIERMFPPRRAMRPNKSWTNGISTRAGTGRLTRLQANPGAGPLAAKLDQLDDSKIKALRTFSAVNLEQAAQGFRVTLVANVTGPLLFLTVANLLIPGGLAGLFVVPIASLAFLLWFYVVGTFLAFFLLICIIAYALAALNQARDIRHVIDLQAAQRGIYFGLEDAEGLHSP